MNRTPDKQTLETLRKVLVSDPTNVDAANLYWNALGRFSAVVMSSERSEVLR